MCRNWRGIGDEWASACGKLILWRSHCSQERYSTLKLCIRELCLALNLINKPCRTNVLSRYITSLDLKFLVKIVKNLNQVHIVSVNNDPFTWRTIATHLMFICIGINSKTLYGRRLQIRNAGIVELKNPNE